MVPRNTRRLRGRMISIMGELPLRKGLAVSGTTPPRTFRTEAANRWFPDRESPAARLIPGSTERTVLYGTRVDRKERRVGGIMAEIPACCARGTADVECRL